MADGVTENIFLVNAPAGSGKTTWIRRQVENYILHNPNDNVLCITYTNRAAEELGRDLDGSRVYFGTIHSFIKDFIGSFFSSRLIVDLYWEVYGEQILKRIENPENRKTWTESNKNYEEKNGILNLENIHSNIKNISYNEAAFNSLYKGALGHDDLISFARIVVDRFPVIKKKISDKYQLIFIDEYQDTAADVLHIFYASVYGKKSKLYLLGDKMQQIYRNYNGEFEEQFKKFNRTINLSTNYRCTPKIVSILNAIYNDNFLKQDSYKENKDESMDFLPKVLIVTDVVKSVSDFRRDYEDAFILYLSNKSRFYDIGAGKLYSAYTAMNKYSYGKKYSAVDVLTKEEIRKQDTLLSFLFIVNQIVTDYMQGYYGEVFKAISENCLYWKSEKFIIRKHSDKKLIKDKMNIIVNSYNKTFTTIDEFLKICIQNDYIKKEFYSVIIDDPDYQLVKNTSVQEVKALVQYLNNPHVSTQHGVKGESHNTVLFVADNSYTNPMVHMSEFFELWSNINITLSEFDSFYYKYSRMIQNINSKIGMKCSELTASTYNLWKNEINSILQSFTLENEFNPYYIQLLKPKMDKYYGKMNFTTVKDCLKEGMVYGVLCAYRLFYVGCSRARKNLAIIINKKDIEQFETKLRDKLAAVGFEVV